MTKNTLGETLVSIRETLGFSRQDVERLSSGEFKAAIIRLYERGERTISVNRLIRLCDFYGVDVRDVLSPNTMEIISLKGLDETDKKLLKNTAARLRRKCDNEEASNAS